MLIETTEKHFKFHQKVSGKIRSQQSGQTLIELALLLPFLCLLMIGIIELGRFGYIGILVGNAARAGTAYGTQTLAQSVDTVGITTAVNNDFKNNGQPTGNLNVSSAVSCGCDNAGTLVTAACVGVGAGTCASGHWIVNLTVTASGTFTSIFNYPGMAHSVTVNRTSSMRVRPV